MLAEGGQPVLQEGRKRIAVPLEHGACEDILLVVPVDEVVNIEGYIYNMAVN